jgi:hypothetical protein
MTEVDVTMDRAIRRRSASVGAPRGEDVGRSLDFAARAVVFFFVAAPVLEVAMSLPPGFVDGFPAPARRQVIYSQAGSGFSGCP